MTTCEECNKTRALVLRLIVAQYRNGWETGESEEEIRSIACDHLYNWGLDPHNNKEVCREILDKYNPEVSLAQVRSMQEKYSSALKEIEELEDENIKLAEEASKLKDEANYPNMRYY